MVQSVFDAPIPGMSLTQEPGKYPWERPPQITDPKEAVDVHLERLMDPDRMEAILYLIEVEELSIKDLVTGIMRSAVANGVHTVDVGLLVAPAVHEFIKRTADTVGIEYDEGLEDKKGKEKIAQQAANQRAKKMLRESGAIEPEVSLEGIMDTSKEEAEASIKTFEEKPASKGLMSRRAE